ncbi:hypothetical protein CAPTEDRAFT_175988 [Capitella teleta]|uniref:D-aminoacyl-tRNA deacylase n=1 Tax=Capitella teleta TaxID=283909 RepID=R7TVH6_CAPTE|nr:hypothetical protein CAPTEDRAFT_175988 [Capitella teleta]|eukprot:ELT95466.1 hypothetical protein CAPTEDRAFT_175988 [Capitella teleta]
MAEADLQSQKKPQQQDPMFARVVLQQCISARLQIRPATADSSAEFVQIREGLVVHTCFCRGATAETVAKLATKVLNARVFKPEDSEKAISVLNLPGDVLIVPQATLGGRLKGNVLQYHRNLAKDESLKLYTDFVELCTKTVGDNNNRYGYGCQVFGGTYGNRQVLSMETNGPHSNIVEI